MVSRETKYALSKKKQKREYARIDEEPCECESSPSRGKCHQHRPSILSFSLGKDELINSKNKCLHRPREARRKLAFAKCGNASTMEGSATTALMSQANFCLMSTGRQQTLPANAGMRHTYSDAAMTPSAATKSASDSQGFNALYDVSQEFMRMSGYSPRYKWLLSNGGTGTATTPPTPTASSRRLDPTIGFSISPRTSFKEDILEENAVLEHASESGAIRDNFSNERPWKRRDLSPASRRRATRAQNLYDLQKSMKYVFHAKKLLMQQRTKACDLSVVFALIGLALTIAEAELTAVGTILKGGQLSNTIKTVIVTTTIILLGFVIRYHWLTAKILLITSGADDWRVTVQFHRLLQCVIELIVCSVCPVPGSIEINWQILSHHNHRSVSLTKIPLDALLSVLMFLRAYLVCRFIALHNRRYQNSATRTIAALNHVNVDFHFALKTMMHERPLMVLVTFAVTFWMVMSWLLTQCERYSGRPEGNQYLNSVWLVVVTFTSIGYGDLVPQTYCGRALAIATGIMGAGVSSALIAVISKRMELTRSEKQVNQFIKDSKLGRIKKNTAAAVLQHTWFIHRYKKSPAKIDQHKLRAHQRKFLNAINQFRCVKWSQRRLSEEGCALQDVPKLQSQMQQSLTNLRRGQETLAAQIKALDRGIDQMIAVYSCQQTTTTAITGLATAIDR